MRKQFGTRLGALLLALSLLCGCAGQGTPAETAETPSPAPTAAPSPSPTPAPAPTPSPSPSPSPSPEPPEERAEELIRQYMEENDISSQQLLAGYYNTATGEEAYVSGDVYQEAASMYKVALCMYWAEKVAEGELDWDYRLLNVPLEDLVEQTLVKSSNTCAEILFGVLGSYREYRRTVMPFYGELSEEEQTAFCRTSAVTPRQMIHVLKMLNAEPERYPRVLDYMSRAKPDEYFNYKPLPWKVAHKYGYLDNGPLIVNDCGVIYTEEPFLLVVMTKNLPQQQQHMNALCRLLGEYTQGEP